MNTFFNHFYKRIAKSLPKVGAFFLSGLSASFMYFYYSILKLFQMHRHSMLSEDYQIQFKAAPCSTPEVPSTCFWEKIQTTSPDTMSNFRNNMVECLPLIGLTGGIMYTFAYYCSRKMGNTVNHSMATLSDSLFSSYALDSSNSPFHQRKRS